MFVAIHARFRSDLRAHVRQDDTKDIGLGVIEKKFGTFERVPADAPDLVHEDGPVDSRTDGYGIGHGKNRRRIEQHHVVVFMHLRNERLDLVEIQKFAGIAGRRSAGQYE